MGNSGRQTVLVTGATGFLGEYLVKRLTKKYRVLALGRNEKKGRQLEDFGASFCPGDLTKRESCAPYFKGVDYVIHAGALSTVWGKWEDFYRINVQGTDLVADLCLENDVRRLVYLSSPSIYTAREDQYGIQEDQAPEKNELNYYIKSKLMAESVLRKWQKKGLETVILRPRGLIGVGDTSLVPRVLAANSKTGIPLFREGRNLVDLTSVENVALACELALTAEKAAGRAFNITNGEPMEFRKILEQFLDAIGESPHYRRLPFGVMYRLAWGLEWLYRSLRLSGEPPLTCYTVCTLGYAQTMDIRPAREILGYKPEKTLAESIREYGAWWRETQGTAGTDSQRELHRTVRVASRREAQGTAGTDGRRETYGTDGAASRREPQGTAGTGSRKETCVSGKSRILEKPGKVKSVKLYKCGYCVNNLGLVFRGMRWEKRRFPARAALIRHKELGNILYDTGYSEKIFGGGPVLWLYRLLNPVCLEKGKILSEQLKKDHIPPKGVKTILLSHAHPDHIGGLSRFSGYELMAFHETLDALNRPRIRNLVFPNLLPPKGSILRQQQPENRLKDHFLCEYIEEVYDLFGDGSIIGIRLDGHSKGQMGLWIPDVSLLLAADACWGSDLIRETKHMRLLPRLIQNDFSAYEDSLERICRVKRDHPQIRVVFTHQKEV